MATRFNPIIRAFYQRLQRAGKAKTVAFIACLHKLLTVFNAMLKHRMPWREVETRQAETSRQVAETFPLRGQFTP
jgi:transposase